MGVNYKVVNSKESHDKTRYFCDTPCRFCVKWNTHTSSNFRTRIHMLNYQGDSNPTANADDAPNDFNISQANTDISSITNATEYYYVTSILSSDFNIMDNHPEAKYAIATSLIELNQA